MPRRAASTVVVALLVTLLFAAGCGQAPEESGDSGEMEIRAYKVPEGIDVDQLRNSLAQSLGMGNEGRLGTAYTYGDGSVVVTAPASVHAGVEALIEQLKTTDPGTMPEPKTVTIDYWMVVGRSPSPRVKWPPIDERGKLIDSPDRRWERELEAIAPALAQIQTIGPQAFRLLEKLRLTSTSSGEPSRISGRFASVEQRVRTLGSGKWLADIEIRIGSQQIQTRASLEPGKFIVLGETGLRNRDFPLLEASDDENLMLYYIISADID